MKTAIQFVAALVAAMLGEYVTCRLLQFPSMSQTRFWGAVVFWSVAILAYLVPRSVMRTLRTRVLGSLLVVSVLAVARVWFAQYLRIPAGMLIVLAPLPALFVFCVAAFLTEPPRVPSKLLAVLLTSVAVQFFSMWWSYSFDTDLVIKLTVSQVIPFLSATAVLLMTDNFIKTGDKPKTVSTNIVNSAR